MFELIGFKLSCIGHSAEFVETDLADSLLAARQLHACARIRFVLFATNPTFLFWELDSVEVIGNWFDDPVFCSGSFMIDSKRLTARVSSFKESSFAINFSISTESSSDNIFMSDDSIFQRRAVLSLDPVKAKATIRAEGDWILSGRYRLLIFGW